MQALETKLAVARESQGDTGAIVEEMERQKEGNKKKAELLVEKCTCVLLCCVASFSFVSSRFVRDS